MIISLVGPNLYAKQRELRALVGSTLTERILGEDGLAKWFEQLGQSDLFGQSAVLVGERIFEDLPKSDQGILAGHLVSHGVSDSDQTVIFKVVDDKYLQKSALGEVLLNNKVMHFPQPTKSKVGLWVEQEAARLGVAISKPAIVKLVDKLGVDQFALSTELERWSLQMPAEITVDDLDAIPALEADVDTFGLTAAWEQKNTAAALRTLVELRLHGIADQMIIGMLGWKVESLLLQAIKRSRVGKWSREELEQAMVDLYALDLAVKQGKADVEVGLELWLVETT